MLPCESDSHKGREEGVNFSPGLSILLKLPGHSPFQKMPSFYQSQETLLVWSKPCAADSTEATEVTSTIFWSCKHSVIPSEDTQNILYFQCLLLRLAIFLEDKSVCVRHVLLVHPQLKAAAHTGFTQERPGNTFFLEINVASCRRETCKKIWSSLLGLQMIHKQMNLQVSFVKAIALAFYRWESERGKRHLQRLSLVLRNGKHQVA